MPSETSDTKTTTWYAVPSEKYPGREYYFNPKTNQSTWILPDEDHPHPNECLYSASGETEEPGDHDYVHSEDHEDGESERNRGRKTKTASIVGFLLCLLALFAIIFTLPLRANTKVATKMEDTIEVPMKQEVVAEESNLLPEEIAMGEEDSSSSCGDQVCLSTVESSEGQLSEEEVEKPMNDSAVIDESKVDLTGESTLSVQDSAVDETPVDENNDEPVVGNDEPVVINDDPEANNEQEEEAIVEDHENLMTEDADTQESFTAATETLEEDIQASEVDAPEVVEASVSITDSTDDSVPAKQPNADIPSETDNSISVDGSASTSSEEEIELDWEAIRQAADIPPPTEGLPPLRPTESDLERLQRLEEEISEVGLELKKKDDGFALKDKAPKENPLCSLPLTRRLKRCREQTMDTASSVDPVSAM